MDSKLIDDASRGLHKLLQWNDQDVQTNERAIGHLRDKITDETGTAREVSQAQMKFHLEERERLAYREKVLEQCLDILESI